MNNYPFREEEMQVVGTYPKYPMPYGAPGAEMKKYNTPITPKENFARILNHEKPLWIPSYYADFNFIQPRIMPDAQARWKGGKDWFGIEWEYEPVTDSSMVKPGTRRLADISDWKEKLEFPNLSEIDWKKDFRENYEGKISADKPTAFVIVNGLFERTADLTSFEDAFCYLLEEPEVLHEFYARLTEWHIELCRVAREEYGADIIIFHDDMGSQRSPFFSTNTYRELLLPYYKRMNDAIHEMGMCTISHACGNMEIHLDALVDAGFDGWEGQDNSNDKKMTMEVYGDRLFQTSGFVPTPGMPVEEMLEQLEKMVKNFGSKGRFLIWLNTIEQPYLEKGSELIYRLSREMYSKED